MSRTPLLWLAVAAALLLAGPPAAGEDRLPRESDPLVVIAHPDVPGDEIARDDLARAFLGLLGEWSDGQPIVPVDLSMSSPTRRLFSTRVLGRTLGEVARYWKHQDLSAPRVSASEEEAVERVAVTPGAVGYVSRPPRGAVKVLALTK